MPSPIIALFAIASALLRPHSPDQFRFVLYGDDRDGHDIHRKIVGMIEKEKPVMVINSGDLVKRGNNPALWKIFDDITGKLRKETDYYAARGNHDVGDPDFQTRFTAPISSGNHLWYSFDRGSYHFIGLAVDENTNYGPSSEQYKWMISDLDAAKAKSEHIIVFFHVPPYSIGSHGPNEDEQKVLCPIFSKYGVVAVLNGHDHIYYHTKRAGVVYIVSGGGGAPLYPCDPSEGAIDGDKWESVNHYIVFDVSTTNIHARVVRLDGSVLEEFDIPVSG